MCFPCRACSRQRVWSPRSTVFVYENLREGRLLRGRHTRRERALRLETDTYCFGEWCEVQKLIMRRVFRVIDVLSVAKVFLFGDMFVTLTTPHLKRVPFDSSRLVCVVVGVVAVSYISSLNK